MPQDLPEDAVSNAKCNNERSPYLLGILERPCNTHPCLTYSWVADQWIQCPVHEPSCKHMVTFVAMPLPGRRYRSVSCLDSLGRTVDENKCEQSLRPSIEEAGPTEKLGLCDLPEATTCSDHGICSNNTCTCQQEYHGIACEVNHNVLSE